MKQIVDDFPIHVSPDFRRNAMNPMRFLGLAVAIHQTSDVLLYETSGMDPMGIRKIHSYAQEHYNGGCLVHACWQPMGDSCPNAGVCVNVKLESAEATEPSGEREPPVTRALKS